MKKMKKFASILLALVMAMALTVPALADETKVITINNQTSGHTYEAYQIFAGTVSTNEDKLSDVVWGSSLTTAGQTALVSAFELEDGTEARAVAEYMAANYGDQKSKSAAELADVIANVLKVPANVTSFVALSTYNETNKNYTLTVAPGYYLIKDQAGSPEAGADDTATDFMLQIVGNVSIDPKASGTPTPDKNVKDKNDSNVATDNTNNTWGDSADHDVGDTIEYQLIARLPDGYTDYKHYKLEFVDNASTGLTISKDSVKAYIVAPNGDTGTASTTGSPITPNNINLTNESHDLTVTFNNLKTDNRVVAGSYIVVEYTATLNDNAVFKNDNTMHLVFSNDPNWDGEGTPPTGESEEVTVVVFTYNPVVSKIDKDGNALKGAMFTLSKWNGTNWIDVEGKTDFAVGETTKFEFKGVDDGIYKLAETTVPDGYNKVADIYFEVVANHSTETSKPDVYEVTYNEETGEFIRGSKTESFTFVVTDNSLGEIQTNVTNLTGAQMPETGGIGTTIFYTLGGLMVVAAGVLLVTKRRMQSKG